MDVEPVSKAFFQSPTFGRLSFDEVFEKIVQYVRESPHRKYSLVVGTDSLEGDITVFVSAIIIHRKGAGGKYFYRKIRRDKIENLKTRIFTEASLSLELAEALQEKLSENGFSKLPIEIHLDIGKNGATRAMVKELVKMIAGSGYVAVTKPDSFGATKVADRHTD